VIQFLNPIWLAAAAAVVVPVILHMWNDRRGKVLRIGSVALLAEGVQRMAWRRRVSQWLLLLVRCLLLVAVAMLLARPRFDFGVRVKGWVLTAFQDGRVEDSLVKAGWERHIFQDTNNYWEGFRLADRMAPAGVAFYVLTPGLARRFVGEKPVTDREIRWDVAPPGDSVNRWTEAAWMISGDSVRVLEGFSRATGCWFNTKTASAPAGGVVVDTSVYRVAIFADAAYQQDGRYVKAAVMALRDFSSRRIEIMEGIGNKADWLFWLSDRSLPDIQEYGHVFQYMSGKDSGSGEVIWRDGYGRGVLVREGEKYGFFGRLSPDWNGLVWSADLPIWLERVFFARHGRAFAETSADKDLRMLDPQQIVPLRGEADRDLAGLRGMGGEGHGGPATDGGAEAFLLWIVIFLFILERILANGKQTT
jgi:hypothetical protein